MNRGVGYAFLLLFFLSHNIAAKTNKRQAKPLTFSENKGQITDQYQLPRPDIQFKICAGNGLSIFIGNGAIHYQYSRTINSAPPKTAVSNLPPAPTTYILDRLDITLLSANKNAQAVAEEKQGYHINYYTPAAGAGGITVYNYNKVTYKNIYPNIDWVLYIKDGHLKHDFIVHAGGDPKNIRIKYDGASGLQLNAAGALIAETPQGMITELAPYTYQKSGKKINSRFMLKDNILSYDIDYYTGELILDPTLMWATYYGDTDEDHGDAVVTDADGYVYMAGATKSTSDIVTTGAHQIAYGGNTDAFLVKFDKDGVRQWATYFGGNEEERAKSLDVDRTGNIYMAGNTYSASHIATPGSHQVIAGGCDDGFLAKFNSAGKRQWSTYYGGDYIDEAICVKTDIAGNVFVSGYTLSERGISTPGAHQTDYCGVSSCLGDAFLAKFDSSGNQQWGTYYYGPWCGMPLPIAIDNNNNIYLVGLGASMTTPSSGESILTKFNDAGVLLWRKNIGEWCGNTLVCDHFKHIYVAGRTNTVAGIATPGTHQTSYGGGMLDGFVAKYNSAGEQMWGTYYGGADIEYINQVTADEMGNVYVTGATESLSGIAVTGAYQPALNGEADAFIAKFNSTGSLTWASYFGGGKYDEGFAICTDGSDKAYIAGATVSTGIATPTAHQPVADGGTDAFLAKFNICSPPVAAAISGSDSICVGAFSPLYCSASGGAWSSVNGNVSVSAGGIVTGLTAGIDTVVYTVADACGSIDSRLPIAITPAAKCLLGSHAIQHADDKIKIYPNPSKGEFSVLLSSTGGEEAHLTITSILGETVKKITIPPNKLTIISLEIPPGVYFLNANTAYESYKAEIVVQ